MTENIVVTHSTDVTTEGQTFQVSGLIVNQNQDGSIVVDGSLAIGDSSYDIQSAVGSPLDFGSCDNGAPATGIIELIGINGTSASADFGDIAGSCNTFELCIVEGEGMQETCTTEIWDLNGPIG